MPGVDLEYVVDPWTVKENIIVSKPASQYTYQFKLEMTGLYPVLQEDGSVLIYNNITEAVDYEIPAPYMYDAGGEMSFDVSYALAENNGIYHLAVTADEVWINENDREFPVVVDPTINTKTGTANMDTYITGDLRNDSRGSYKFFFVGENEVAYVYIPTPVLPSDAIVTSAYLSLYYFYKDFVESGYVDITAHKVRDLYWAEHSLTWNSVVNGGYYNFGLDDAILGGAIRTYGSLGATSSNPYPVSINVIDAVRSWVEGDSENLGIGLKFVFGGPNRSVLFRSKEGESSYRPKLVYTYRFLQSALIGVTSMEAQHDHHSALNASAVKLRAAGYSAVDVKAQTEFGAATIKNDMKTYNIIATRSHGKVIRAKTGYCEQLGTAIILNDEVVAMRQSLFSSCALPDGASYSDMSYIAAADSFNNIDLVLFIGCETGLGGIGGLNLPTAIVAAGAKVAIGFENEVYCENANDWTETFFDALCKGKTVEASARLASASAEEASGLKSVIICGDGNFKLQ